MFKHTSTRASCALRTRHCALTRTARYIRYASTRRAHSERNSQGKDNQGNNQGKDGKSQYRSLGGAVAGLSMMGMWFPFKPKQDSEEDKRERPWGARSEHYSTSDEYWQDNPRSAGENYEWSRRPGTEAYGDALYPDKFRKYGYGQPVPENDLWVHHRAITSEERNMGSREALRLKAKDPKTLPTFTLKEFKKMSGKPGVIIAGYRGGVYDMTKFLHAHPGHDRILMANGNDLDAFWNVYKLHYRPHIQHLIEDFRIGNLSHKDAIKLRDATVFPNMFTDEPARPRSILRMASERPCNSGPSYQHLTTSFYTPNELHYSRNHCPVPRVDPEEYRFVVQENPSIGLRGAEFTLNELKGIEYLGDGTKFKPHVVSSTLQCAGSRQEDFVIPDRPLYVEAKWREEAWGTARWRGTKVRDILKHCGLDVDAMSLGEKEAIAKYVNLWAMDESETGQPYATFIAFDKAIDPLGDTIIAWEMNGEDVPRDHGYPCRVLAPGVAGFRNCKWIEEISVTTAEEGIAAGCDQHNQHFGPEISFRGHFIPGKVGEGPTPDLMDVSAPRVVTVPVYSTIGVPGMGQVYPGDTDSITVKGVAWAGGGRGINRVEVSIDGGRNFRPAKLLEKPPEVRAREPDSSMGVGRIWTWQQWELDVKLTDKMKKAVKNGQKVEIEVVSRARDGDFNVQPQSVEDSYNVLGKCVNHWPRKVAFIDPKYKTGDTNIPAMLPIPPAGQWVWSKHYPIRLDQDKPVQYGKEFESESVKLDSEANWTAKSKNPYALTPTPPRSEWW